MSKVIIGVLFVIIAAGAIFFASKNTSINKTQDSPKRYTNNSNQVRYG